MKNGDFNKTEELLQKRFDGVKNDIKDPGFINIKYKEKENKESFFKKPAVYAAGLVLVAVLVCGGTFIGLKLLERIGAQNVASSSTPSINENSETVVNNSDVTEETEENKGYYPVYLKIECGGKSEYPQSYMRWESVNDGENENIKYASGTNSEYRDLDNVIIFESAVLGFQWYYTPEDGMEATVKCRLAGEEELFDIGDIQSILGGCARGNTYRLIAVAEFKSVSDGVTREGCYEYPFDFYYIDDSESAGYLWETEVTTGPEETTVPEETTGSEETTDITPPKGKPPVYLKVFDANEIIYPDAYGFCDTEGAKNVPVLHYDGSDIDIAYVQPSGRCYVGYRRYGSDEEEHISVDYINDYLKHAHTGNYRFIVNFSIETGDEIIGYDYPFDVEVLIKEVTTGPEETTGPVLNDPETPDLKVKVTCGAKTIEPDAYAAYGGGVDEDPAYMSDKVPYITYVNDGLKVEYDEKYVTNVVYGIDLWSRIYDLDGLNDHLKKAAEGTYRIVVHIERETHDKYGNIFKSAYDYPFDVEVLRKEETTGADTEETAPYTEDMPYQVYIVRNQSGMLEAADTSTTRYNGENLLKCTEIYKKDVPEIKLNLLGYERDLRFMHTDVIYAYGKTLDCYKANNNVERVYIDHDTGKIVMYNSTGNTKDKYESPVNAYSSREEFVNYAKELLLEYTGVSAEGCEVRIKTVGIRTTYKYTQDEIIDGFANFTKYDPDFYAEYDITFYKKINGVNRADVMRVMMKNNGVVKKVFGIELDDVYEPYLDTEIDADSITKYVESQMDLLKEKYDIRSQEITLTAIQVDGCYWVQADLRYTFMREYDGKLTSDQGIYLILIDGDFENPDYPYDYDMYIEYVYEYDLGDDTQFG